MTTRNGSERFKVVIDAILKKFASSRDRKAYDSLVGGDRCIPDRNNTTYEIRVTQNGRMAFLWELELRVLRMGIGHFHEK